MMSSLDRFYTEFSQELAHHPLYEHLVDQEALRIFMEHHVFAVFDFMSLLKSLHNHLNIALFPWRPSPFSGSVVRMINEIVLGEESDLNAQGKPQSHFEMYLEAMEEVGANTSAIRQFSQNFNPRFIPEGASSFVEFNLSLAQSGDIEEVASCFLYGREKVLPQLFSKILQILKNARLECPGLIYYLDRHIELDGEEHGPMAGQILAEICQNDPQKWAKAERAARLALNFRKELWDGTLKVIQRKTHSQTSTIQS